MEVLATLSCARKFQPPSDFLLSASSDPQDALGTQKNPKKVLVVDDEVDLADMALALFVQHEIECVVAYSASEALLLLESDTEIDVVFSDIRMPGMSGLELEEVIRQLFPQVKVLLTSGYIPPSLLNGYSKVGRIVAKPYEIADIVKMLRD